MVRRCAKAAGITTEVCNHTFRGTGITAYLENGGTLEKARQMAATPLSAAPEYKSRSPHLMVMIVKSETKRKWPGTPLGGRALLVRGAFLPKQVEDKHRTRSAYILLSGKHSLLTAPC